MTRISYHKLFHHVRFVSCLKLNLFYLLVFHDQIVSSVFVFHDFRKSNLLFFLLHVSLIAAQSHGFQYSASQFNFHGEQSLASCLSRYSHVAMIRLLSFHVRALANMTRYYVWSVETFFLFINLYCVYQFPVTNNLLPCNTVSVFNMA